MVLLVESTRGRRTEGRLARWWRALLGRPVKASRRRITGWSVRFETPEGVIVRRFPTKTQAKIASGLEPGGGADPQPCYGRRGA